MSQISNSNPSTTRLDEVLARARERCLIASTQKDSENPTPNSTTGNPNPTKLESIYDVIERSLGYGIEPPVFRGKSRPPYGDVHSHGYGRGKRPSRNERIRSLVRTDLWI